MDRKHRKMLEKVLLLAREAGWDVDVVREDGDVVNGLIIGTPDFIETALSYLPEKFETKRKDVQ